MNCEEEVPTFESDGSCFDDYQIKSSYQHSLLEKIKDEEVLLNCYYECRKNVNWKCSIQNFEHHLIKNIKTISEQLKEGEPVTKGFNCFDINERGKLRHIMSIDISERIVQKALCKHVLIPILSPSLIYDSGASLKGKGTSFTRRRLMVHLTKYYKEFGNKGYILLMDYHDYFGRINHVILKDLIYKKIYDIELLDLIFFYIDYFGDKGLGLGSEVSQILAVYYLSEVDHYIKEQLSCKYYGRYMDDSYIIENSKDRLHVIFSEISVLLSRFDIELNPKKLQIRKIDETFVFLKFKYKLSDSGKVLRIPIQATYKRMEYKVNKLIELEKEPQIIDHVLVSYRGIVKQTNCGRRKYDLYLQQLRCSYG